MLVPKLKVNLKKRKQEDAISLYLKDFEFEQELTSVETNHAVALLDFEPFADSDKRTWLPSNQRYFDEMPADDKMVGVGKTTYEGHFTVKDRFRSGAQPLTKKEIEIIVDAFSGTSAESELETLTAYKDEEMTEEVKIIENYEVVSDPPFNVIKTDTGDTKVISILNDEDPFGGSISIGISYSRDYHFVDVRGPNVVLGTNYPVYFYYKTYEPIPEGTPLWLYPTTYNDDRVDPDDLEIGTAFKAEPDNGNNDARYWQVGVARGDTPSVIPRVEFFLGKDNNIYRGGISLENRIFPVKTEVFKSDKLAEAQYQAIRELVNSRYNENIVITANDVTQPLKLQDVELFQWIRVYDKNGMKREFPVSEITEENGEVRIKLGFQTTLFTEVIKKGW